MFYTVTLPATIWFFDKAKTDDRILFIDARNIFTQIDRAHREFSEEQIQNISIISQLHKGRRDKFIQLIDRYFEAGMQRLVENKANVTTVSEQLLDVLEDAAGKQAVGELVHQWAALTTLQTSYAQYKTQYAKEANVDKKNSAQQQLREAFTPFFEALHHGLKALDKTVRQHEKHLAELAQAAGKRSSTDRKTNALKTALEALHDEVKNAELYYQHIYWLQTRFPQAAYEDVTGLCKLATPAEVKEQDYSLNAGRYVGVVIEEDGKTEEEFIQDLLSMNEEMEKLSTNANQIKKLIHTNLTQLVGE
jgi:type I restriction enzyme M protein